MKQLLIHTKPLASEDYSKGESGTYMKKHTVLIADNEFKLLQEAEEEEESVMRFLKSL